MSDGADPLAPIRRSLTAWIRDALADPSARVGEPLTGATSSLVCHVHARAGPLVVRCFTDTRWSVREPDLAEHEAVALDVAARAGLPVPRPIGHVAATESPFGLAAVLMTRVAGRPLLTPASRADWLERLAARLAEIHQADPRDLCWRYASWRPPTLERPDWLDDTGLWRSITRVLAAGEPATPRVFIHRDYHPVNVLWAGGDVVSVIDWVNACVGPPGVDVSHCRVNLALLDDADSADAFLDAYRGEAPDYRHHAYFDVDAAMAWLPDVPHYAPWSVFGRRRLPPRARRRRLMAFVRRTCDAAHSA